MKIFSAFYLLLLLGLTLQPSYGQKQPLSDSAFAIKELNKYYKSQYSRNDYTAAEIQQANAEMPILHKFPLIVRLKTNKRQIESYRSSGDTKTAERINIKTQKQNLEIISACIRLYNFSKIYFMDGDDQANFRQTDSLKFSSLLFEKDTFIYLNHDSVYYLDFGILFGRTQSSEWKYKDYGLSEESSNVAAENAFVIRNAKDNQLVPPIPFAAIVLFQGGRKSKESLSHLTYDVDLFGPQSNTVIIADFEKSNEYDAAIFRLNSRLFHVYGLLKDKYDLIDNSKLWLKNNPNKYLYPLWINVEKKLLSIQEKIGGQFIKQN